MAAVRLGPLLMIKSIFKSLVGERNLGRLDYVFKPGLKDGCGGPLNGQVYRRRIYEDILRGLPLDAIVETGTFRGTTTTLFAESGLPVYTVEASPRFHAYAERHLSGVRGNVHLQHGDSRAFLRGLARDAEFTRGPVLFYLDAHWGGDLPLREEVEIIFAHWDQAVILVDDFEVPGTDYAFDDYGHGKALNLAYLSAIPHLEPYVYFPAVGPEEETGLKRGCVVLSNSADMAEALDAAPTLKRHVNRPSR